ncbi:MAG: hypothetical protein OHK0039_38720 [Bacteroidia bacterium]
MLQKYGELDLLVSGTQSELNLPYTVRYRCKGASFVYNRKGGIDYLKSITHNFSSRLYREIASLPVKRYDLIVNDFEPVSAWAARIRGVPCVALGHQAAFRSPLTPRPPEQDPLGEWILKNYAPANSGIGFHFERYEDYIYPPVIRKDIRDAAVGDKGHYTVYLPAFNERRLLSLLANFPEVDWQVFSRYTRREVQQGNVWLRRVDAQAFTESFLNCRGILTGAGFETPAEALYMGKKLFVVPIKGQYEQYCNAAALERLGVTVAYKVKENFPLLLHNWIREDQALHMAFTDMTEEAIARAFDWHKTSYPRPVVV